jgi:hypothetical protein
MGISTARRVDVVVGRVALRSSRLRCVAWQGRVRRQHSIAWYTLGSQSASQHVRGRIAGFAMSMFLYQLAGVRGEKAG